MEQQEFNSLIHAEYFTIRGAVGRHGRSSSRIARSENISSAHLTITHWLSGTVVSGTIPDGYYSKKKLGLMQVELKQFLEREMLFILSKKYRLAGISPVKQTNKKFVLEIRQEKLEACVSFCKRLGIERNDVIKYFRK